MSMLSTGILIVTGSVLVLAFMVFLFLTLSGWEPKRRAKRDIIINTARRDLNPSNRGTRKANNSNNDTDLSSTHAHLFATDDFEDYEDDEDFEDEDGNIYAVQDIQVTSSSHAVNTSSTYTPSASSYSGSSDSSSYSYDSSSSSDSGDSGGGGD